MTPAAATGLTGAATLPAPGLRWPAAGGANVPLVALAGVAIALILAAGVNLLIRPAVSLSLRSELAPASAPPNPPMAVVTPTDTAPTSELTLARLTAGQPRAATGVGSADAATAERAATSRGASQATTGADDGSRLGPITVLADLTATNTPATTPKQLIVGRGNLYVLDPYTSTLYLIDSAGKAPTPLLTRGWSIGREKVTDLVGATWRGDTLVVMDRHRAYTLDGPNGTWRVAPLAGASLGAGVHPVGSFEGSLYVLDSVKNQVLKFAQGAYARPPLPWLKQQEKVDLSGAVDIAIDGRIYALTASGQLLTLSRGVLERRRTDPGDARAPDAGGADQPGQQRLPIRRRGERAHLEADQGRRGRGPVPPGRRQRRARQPVRARRRRGQPDDLRRGRQSGRPARPTRRRPPTGAPLVRQPQSSRLRAPLPSWPWDGARRVAARAVPRLPPCAVGAYPCGRPGPSGHDDHGRPQGSPLHGHAPHRSVQLERS